MSIYPSVDESFDRLHRAGWCIGETAGSAVWIVTGTNGDVDQPYCLLRQKCLGLPRRLHSWCSKPTRHSFSAEQWFIVSVR